MIRIIAGTHRSRKLAMPESEDIRPTTDKAREALFSMLTHRLGAWDEVRVLDACCGSGAFGLEAISRGAAHAVFLDTAREALKTAQANAATLKEQHNCTFIMASVVKPPAASAPCDLILMDAPYDKGLSEKGLKALTAHGWATPAALAAIETARDEKFTPPEGWSLLTSRAHGPAMLWILERTTADLS